ncbi:hypothetical protein CR513_37746, partial [Mucuna pruriens]
MEVMREITLPIRVSPIVFNITFQVMDIHPAYSCLLGRPWIHVAGAVPSSLHQRVKFVNDHQVIKVMGEKEQVISTPTPEEYIEGDEEALETSFQLLEIAGVARSGSRDTTPTSAEDVALQSHDQGRISARQGIRPPSKWYTSPNLYTKKHRQIRTRLSRGQPRGEPILGQYFIRESIAMIGDEPTCQMGWEYVTKEELMNWTVEALLD